MHQEYIKYLWLSRMGMMDTLDILDYGDKRLIGLNLAKGCAGLSDKQFAIDKEFNDNKEWLQYITHCGYADSLYSFIECNFLVTHSKSIDIEERKGRIKSLIRNKADIANVSPDSIPDEIYPVYLILYAMHCGGIIFPMIRASRWKVFARSYARFL